MEVTLNDKIDKDKKPKQVTVRFVGSDDVIQHILPLKEKKLINKSCVKKADLKKNRRVSYAKGLADDDEEDAAAENDIGSGDENEEMEDWRPSKALSVHDEGVIGSDLYSFRTPKKSKQMMAKATESMTPKSTQRRDSQKTPNAKPMSETPSATTSSVKKTPKSALKKTPLTKVKAMDVETPQQTGPRRRSRRQAATTPHRLWKRNDERDSSESSDSCLSTDEEQNEGKQSTLSVATPSSNSKLKPDKALSASGKNKPSTSVSSSKPEPPKRSRKLFDENLVTTENIDSYFDAQTSAVCTSDRTLSRLEMPSISPEEMAETLKRVEFRYEHERNTLVSGYRALFHKWMYLICQGYNLLLHGFGSKYNVMDEFRKSELKDFTHVVVNGYFPSLSIKSILNAITEDVLNHSGSFLNIVDQCNFIRSHFGNGEFQDFFLLVHNIDGTMLRSEKSQAVLSLLAQIKGFHFIASIDHINAPLLWDQTKVCRFRWLWQDITTFEKYANETSYENSLLVSHTGGLAMSSLVHVMRSLTSNARGIFMLLTKYQLDNNDNKTYQGLPFSDLYQRCREAFLVNSELTLQTQLTEFKDHKLIRIKKGLDGVDYMAISLNSSTLTQFMDGEDEQR